MGSRQIVLVSTAGVSVLNAGIFWREAKTKRLFSQCSSWAALLVSTYISMKLPLAPTGFGKQCLLDFIRQNIDFCLQKYDIDICRLLLNNS